MVGSGGNASGGCKNRFVRGDAQGTRANPCEDMDHRGVSHDHEGFQSSCGEISSGEQFFDAPLDGPNHKGPHFCQGLRILADGANAGHDIGPEDSLGVLHRHGAEERVARETEKVEGEGGGSQVHGHPQRLIIGMCPVRRIAFGEQGRGFGDRSGRHEGGGRNGEGEVAMNARSAGESLGPPFPGFGLGDMGHRLRREGDPALAANPFAPAVRAKKDSARCQGSGDELPITAGGGTSAWQKGEGVLRHDLLSWLCK